MTHIKTFIHGMYPRSAELAQATRDMERNRVTKADVEAYVQKDFSELIRLEKSNKFAYLEDGKLSWQDIFRPIVEATEGLETGSLTRWFDNNNFYRQPVITGKLVLDEKKLETYFPKLEPDVWKITLPSPFFFAKTAEKKVPSAFEETIEEVTDLLEKVVRYLDKRGVRFIQFNEPYLPYYGATKKDVALLRTALARLKSAANALVAVHFYFGDAAPVVHFLADATIVDVIGIDFYHTTLTSLPKKLPCDIICGVIDGRNSLLEDADVLHRFIDRAVKHLQPKVLYISNNSELELLPEPSAKAKLALLGNIGRSFYAK